MASAQSSVDTATNALSNAEQQAVSEIAELQANFKSATDAFNTVESAAKTRLDNAQSALDSARDMCALRSFCCASRVGDGRAVMNICIAAVG